MGGGPSSRTRRRREHAQQRKSASREEFARESQAAIAATVFWMMCALATTCAQFTFFLVNVGKRFSEAPLLDLVSRLSLFIALVTGGVAILATPLVLAIRRQNPPKPVTVGVVLLAIASISVAICCA